ncbi:1-acyl-sn-glycerol-3-phosphate acyltransferase-2 [Coleophoma cylindrospora]|uniref:1-acyl-sn-glycerol-3-phosphate acyltransferase-2 n=1 Tax=Coleophoma cylindrospora TaxID=1849047 RepID=A0A3D8SEY3_9HELO|nr:1-acyl-sn-glycerol-3-phosphate acyltransferase-2 [Coleophoma cylindrospora]
MAGNAYTHARGVLVVLPWALHLVLMDLILSSMLPISYFLPDLVYYISSWVAFSNWYWIQKIFEVFNGGKITISGDELPRNESAIVIANHVSWTDFYMIQALAIKSGMLGSCRWFAKIQLRWVPLLGWGIWAMGMPMVSRKWMKDKKELDRVFAGITDRKWPTWLISFSEATRYTPQKYEETKVWCKENEKPLPQHLLYPRSKGFVTTVQHLRKSTQVKAVYDMTIAYSHNNKFLEAPTIWESLSLDSLSGKRGHRFHVHARRFLLSELPETDAELAKWLETRWLEKGKYLESKREEWAREPIKIDPSYQSMKIKMRS